MPVPTICNYPVVCRDADRAMNARGIRDQFPDVIRRDGIAEQYLTGIKTIGAVKCQENIKFNPGEMRQFQRGSSCGKTEDHAFFPQEKKQSVFFP